jgi:hypothetical protein
MRHGTLATSSSIWHGTPWYLCNPPPLPPPCDTVLNRHFLLHATRYSIATIHPPTGLSTFVSLDDKLRRLILSPLESCEGLLREDKLWQMSSFVFTRQVVTDVSFCPHFVKTSCDGRLVLSPLGEAKL